LYSSSEVVICSELAGNVATGLFAHSLQPFNVGSTPAPLVLRYASFVELWMRRRGEYLIEVEVSEELAELDEHSSTRTMHLLP
jgi:hypothetical protein